MAPRHGRETAPDGDPSPFKPVVIPADLTVQLRQGRLYLWSGDREVELDWGHHRETAIFRDGPRTWEFLFECYIRPALAQFQEP